MASARAIDARQGNPCIHADLQEVADQLQREFAARLQPGEVDECLSRMAARFENAKVRSFVPLLVQRYARDELVTRVTNP